MAKTTAKKKRKTTSAKRKKRTPAQIAAFKKMIAARKAKAKKKPATKAKPKRKTTAKKAAKKTTARKAVVKKTTTSKSTGASMAKRKKRRSSGTKRKAVASVGRKAGSFMRKSNATGMLKDAALAIAGGTVAGLLVNKIPVKDARIKAALPIAAGIALSGTLGQKNKMVAGVAQGMVVLGAVGLFKTLAPNVPFLAGEDAVPYIPYGIPYSPDQIATIPEAAEAVGYMGENVMFGENVNLGYYSPADIS